MRTTKQLAYNNKSYKEITGQFWATIKYGAKSRNIPFNITIEEAWELFVKQQKKCAISGIELTHKKYLRKKDRIINNKEYLEGNASLDRIDSTKGYYKENCQWVDKTIQMMKNNYDEKEFLQICERVSNYATK